MEQLHPVLVGQPRSADEEVIERLDTLGHCLAQRLDGKLLSAICLNGLEARAIVPRYRSLANMAPVYHRLREHIRAYALICLLALVLHRVLSRRL